MSPKAVPKVDPNAPLKIEKAQTVNHVVEGKEQKRLYFAGIGVLAVLTIATIAGFVLMPALVKKDEELVVKPAAGEGPITESEEEKRTLNRSDWSLEVLNGSGTAGAAKKAASKLEELGYKVIKTGNADRSDYEGNHLFLTSSSKKREDDLIEDIGEAFGIASSSGEFSDSSASARLIIGK